MHRARGLAFQLALSHGVVALLGCAFLAILLALLLPGVYVRQRQEALVDKAHDLADDMAPWLAGEEAQPKMTIAALEAAGVKVIDTQQRLLAWSSAPRRQRESRAASVPRTPVTRRRGGKGAHLTHKGVTSVAAARAVGERLGNETDLPPGGATSVMQRRITRPMTLTGADRIWQRRWREVLSGRIVRGVSSPVNGERTLVVAVPAIRKGQTVGAVIVHARLADLRAAQSAMLPVIVLGAVAAALAAVLAGVALSRRMARPMQRMTQAAERVAAGELEVHVEPPSWHEGESLALAFNRMTKALAAQERARRQFIADASHQLRAPLTSLQAQTEALLDDIVTDEARRRSFIGRIAEDTKRLAALAQQLLDLERLDAAETAPRREPLDIPSLLHSVADAFPEGEAAKLVVDTETGIPRALADPDEVRQALINLLDNALKHTPATKTVRLWARAEGENLRLGVTDEGEGVPAKHLQRVWDRFYRVPRDSSGGTGLGLAIVKRLVERQAGNVAAESTPGAGSTFSFTLPRA